MAHPVDIPGLTTSGGRPRLPRAPEVVVEGLALAIAGARQGWSQGDLVRRLVKATREDRPRAEGLVGWLPLSRVARWRTDGTLALHPETDLTDLALRYVAWFSTQPVAADQAEAVRAYCDAVDRLALEAGPGEPLPAVDDFALPVADALPTTVGPAVQDALRDKLRTLIHHLDGAFLERGAHVRMALLALLSGQHVLLLGPPGTAKSLLARTLCAAFTDSSYFEYLLSRFTHPDELFGPVSIPGLKDEDYRRLTEGFLPTATVAFLDEIFKANSAILNSLLTLVNERVFHHGRHRDPVPLLGVIGASNELPEPDGGLEALYDRFLVRMSVPPLARPDAFLAVATGTVPTPTVPEDLRITPAEVEALRARAREVVVPPALQTSLVALWQVGQRAEWGVSDRRWRQAVGLLKVAAAADGRDAVVPLDLLLLEPVLAPTPAEMAAVRRSILDQLGTGSLPEHDLRAQWVLLELDRVAPVDGESGWRDPDGGPWGLRIDRRRRSLDRFQAHLERFTRLVGRQRSAVDELAEAHLWVDQVPSAVLSGHLEVGRDLAHILGQVEAYRRELASPEDVVRALLARLPEGARRRFGDSSVMVLCVAGQKVPISLGGERQPPRGPRSDGLVQPDDDRSIPELEVEPPRLLDWLDGRVSDDELVRTLPGWAARNAVTALGSVRRHLGGSAVPSPPQLRAP